MAIKKQTAVSKKDQKKLSSLLPSGAEVEAIAKDEPSFKIESVFIFKSLTMKDDLAWRIKIVVKKILPQTFREYDAILSLNEEPYRTRINDLDTRKRLSAEVIEDLNTHRAILSAYKISLIRD